MNVGHHVHGMSNADISVGHLHVNVFHEFVMSNVDLVNILVLGRRLNDRQWMFCGTFVVGRIQNTSFDTRSFRQSGGRGDAKHVSQSMDGQSESMLLDEVSVRCSFHSSTWCLARCLARCLVARIPRNVNELRTCCHLRRLIRGHLC